MPRFGDLDREKGAVAQEAFDMACRALDAVSGAQRPTARAQYERAIDEAIRQAAAADRFEKAALVRAAIDAILRGPPHS